MKTLGELAHLVGGELVGNPDLEISDVADLDNAGAGEITFVASVKKLGDIANTKASAVVIPLVAEDQKGQLPSFIKVKDPYLAIALIHNLFVSAPFKANGIHERAVVGIDCTISAEITIGPMAVIGNQVIIGDRVTIHPGVIIADGVTIGNDTELYPNVFIGCGTIVGSRVSIYSGAAIGNDGFGYATDRSTGRHVKRPQVGIVQIDDDVDIGANTCIDRATFGKTWIKRGCKIDNLVQIAHNVVVGEDSFIVSQVGISGSSTLGKGVILGGQVGLAGHIDIGNRVMAGAKAGIHNSLPDGAIVSGYPAIPHKLWLRSCSAIQKLPDMVKDIRRLKKQNEQSGE